MATWNTLLKWGLREAAAKVALEKWIGSLSANATPCPGRDKLNLVYPSHSDEKGLYKPRPSGVYRVDVTMSHWCQSLYESHAAQIILYGRALGLGHSEAEDVLQETFLALLEREGAPEQPLHYCLRSFRNRALNYKRSLWRRLTRELESSRWFERAEGETPQERAAMRCLAKLPADQREVIVLKLWHEHTFEEIGELLGLSPNTAAGRYRYGLQKLRACLTGDEYEQLERTGEPTAFVDAPRPVGES